MGTKKIDENINNANHFSESRSSEKQVSRWNSNSSLVLYGLLLTAGLATSLYGGLSLGGQMKFGSLVKNITAYGAGGVSAAGGIAAFAASIALITGIRSRTQSAEENEECLIVSTEALQVESKLNKKLRNGDEPILFEGQLALEKQKKDEQLLAANEKNKVDYERAVDKLFVQNYLQEDNSRAAAIVKKFMPNEYKKCGKKYIVRVGNVPKMKSKKQLQALLLGTTKYTKYQEARAINAMELENNDKLL